MLELWGGHECTVNRVRDRFRDQTRETGHQDRPSDLDAFAAMNIKALRYPVVWERIAPERPDRFDWRWTDARLDHIRRLGMRPIVGLLHHGSGPRYTSLVSDSFVPLFSDFARAAAERYPWVQDWTPVNEPLTTARFSALYGHWYPHAKDERTFWLALLNQIDGVRAAMGEIRKVNPAARLVQTEDLGQTLATDPLAQVADYENARRWMTWDLLCGRVQADHPLWSRLEGFGFAERLQTMADDPCPPDVIGVNHYLTSIRFLDHRSERYPNWIIGPGEHADMDAVRILQPNLVGLQALLRQVWDRYGRPIAVTECHNGCTREEQMRWLFEAWRTCADLQAQGVDVRALTAWALLGGYDWSSLITKDAGKYEVGPFDVRSGEARPTAIVDMLTRLGAGETPEQVQAAFPYLETPGWWRRDIRLEHEPHACGNDVAGPGRPDLAHGAPILLVGDDPLGDSFIAACELRGLAWTRVDGAMFELGRAEIVRRIGEIEPLGVVDLTSERALHAPEIAEVDAIFADRGVAYISISAAPETARGGPEVGTCDAEVDADLARSVLDRLIDGESGVAVRGGPGRTAPPDPRAG